MTVLFGHPSGHPGSHHAALAYFEAGILESFCVPWMPSAAMIRLLGTIGPIQSMARRLSRRNFAPLADAPKNQGRLGEMRRLLLRAAGFGEDRFLANDWLMRTMRKECGNPRVTAVHSFEDCSLWPFQTAKSLGKACIYSMPQAYFPLREQIFKKWVTQYVDWLPGPATGADPHPTAEQKRLEMELADMVIVPSSFLEQSIRDYYPDKKIVLAPYGIDFEFWTPGQRRPPDGRLRFVYAGRLAPHKGIPQLIEAWEKIGLRDVELELIGPWLLADSKLKSLPPNVTWRPPCSRNELRDRYRQADVFVFPSYYEGFGMVLVEALACGLPVICSDATAGPDILTERCGRVIPAGNFDALADSLMWFNRYRDELPAMRVAARSVAESCDWQRYRDVVKQVGRSVC